MFLLLELLLALGFEPPAFERVGDGFSLEALFLAARPPRSPPQNPPHQPHNEQQQPLPLRILPNSFPKS